MALPKSEFLRNAPYWVQQLIEYLDNVTGGVTGNAGYRNTLVQYTSADSPVVHDTATQGSLIEVDLSGGSVDLAVNAGEGELIDIRPTAGFDSNDLILRAQKNGSSIFVLGLSSVFLKGINGIPLRFVVRGQNLELLNNIVRENVDEPLGLPAGMFVYINETQARSIVLPNPSHQIGSYAMVKKRGNTANVTVSPVSGTTLNGSSSDIVLTAQNDYVLVQATANNQDIISSQIT